MAAREYSNILYERKDRVATITLNRPQVLNALNSALLKELYEAFQEAEKDPDVSVIILTGCGDRSFCAGADISELQSLTPIKGRNHVLWIQECTKYIERIQKPVVARINGFCLGGGQEIAMACDFRIAVDKARFGQPEINLAIIPGGGGTQRLPRLIGKTKAVEINMLGIHVDANEAYRLGLLNRVVSAEELDKTVSEFVQALLSKSPAAIGTLKLAMNEGLEMDLERALYYEAECFATTLATDDSKEGMKAFLEKRPPVFKGR
ncbi:MAG: enoyl-CoA hydratase/isomerase family protein [Dehalococcoidia bacterium]|nr:enoyl-CoA hydratase/isomerase family protein [Dehalococcoidia bacterium]